MITTCTQWAITLCGRTTRQKTAPRAKMRSSVHQPTAIALTWIPKTPPKKQPGSRKHRAIAKLALASILLSVGRSF